MENIGYYCLLGLLVLPWILTLATVPNLEEVFRGASFATLVRVALFGVAWGVGSALFGLGVARVGMALGFALILGITASFGSLFPLAILHPEQLSDRRGLALMLGTVVMTGGLALLTRAGQNRERDSAQNSSGSGFAARIGNLRPLRNFLVDAEFQFSIWGRAKVAGSACRCQPCHGGKSHLGPDGYWRVRLEPCLLCVSSQSKQKLERLSEARAECLLVTRHLDRPAMVRWNNSLRRGGSFARGSGRHSRLADLMILDIIVALFFGAPFQASGKAPAAVPWHTAGQELAFSWCQLGSSPRQIWCSPALSFS